MFTARISQLLSIAVFTAAAALSQTTTTGTITETSNTPPVGLASSETVQVNLVNAASNPSNANAPAAACTGTVSFLNASGKTIGTPANFSIASGVIYSTSIPFATVGASTRTEVRAVITRSITLNANTPCSLQGTIETYDTTSGVTHIYYPNIAIGGPIAIPVAVGPGRQ
jgi:hypothetical protein